MALHYINRHEITGFIGKNVELRYLPSGDAVLDISVATTRSWRGKDEQWQQETEWHNCIFFRQLAEDAASTLKPGAAVYIVGRSATRKWVAKDQSARTRREIIVENFHPIAYQKRSEDDNETQKDDSANHEAVAGGGARGDMAGFDVT